MTLIALPHNSTPPNGVDSASSRPQSPWISLSPRPQSPSPSHIIRSEPLTKRARSPSKHDSSDPDHISQAPLPHGKPLPPSPPPPPAKKLKPSGPPPLPDGPATAQTLFVLLHPEHVEQNRPKRFFDFVRPRETKKPLVIPSPGELRVILETMRKVNEIWLRTMGEDESCLACLAMWLKQFINNPKMFETSVVPLLWVGQTFSLRFHPVSLSIRHRRLNLFALQHSPDQRKRVSQGEQGHLLTPCS